MLNQFIGQTKDFLKKININIHEPAYREVTLGITNNLSDSFTEVYTGQINISENLILGITLFFGLLDAKVDEKYPHLEGQSFRQKCKSLPTTKDDEIIFRECYRILKILRNASIHSMNVINVQNGIISCIYHNHKSNTQFQLTITNQALELIQTMIMRMLDSQDTYYEACMNRMYYDAIKAGVSRFQDDISPTNTLMDLSNGLRVDYNLRYVILNPKTSIVGNDLKINNPYTAPPGQYCDYIVNCNSQKYQVPEEAMRNNYTIQLSELSVWRI